MFNDNGYDRILYKCLLILVLLSIILEVNITLTLHGTSTMIVIAFFSIVFNILQVYFLTNKKSTLKCSNTGMIIEKLIESNKNIKPHYQNIAKNNLLKRITKLTDVTFVSAIAVINFIININYILLYFDTSFVQVFVLFIMTTLIFTFSMVILIRDFAQLVSVYPKYVN